MKWLICLCMLFTCALLNAQTVPYAPLNPEAPYYDTSATGEVDSFYTYSERPAEFKGGIPGLMKYLAKTMNYPEDAKKRNIEGKVWVTFIVNRKGKAEQIVIVKSACECFNEEVIRVMKNMPAWKPGKRNKKPVRMKFTLPVNFSLQ